jgi:hypothetical protein
MSTPVWAAIVLALATAAAVAVGTAMSLVVRRIATDDDSVVRLIHRHCYRPVVVTLITVAWSVALSTIGLNGSTLAALRHVTTLAVIGAAAWLVTSVLFVVQDLAFAHTRVDVSDNRRARRVRTQIAIMRRLTAVVIAVLAISAMLLTFDRFRAFGTSLLASAGLIGIVAGVASQSSLTNVFAGVQLAFTDALRFDDVVVVDDEWGRVESLDLMTVTLHLWDERRLILPTSYFTTNPFQNWTRSESRLLGSVLLHLDYSAPMDELRRKTYEIVSDSPLWDQRDWAAQVVDSTPSTMVVRVLASSADASSAWDLRCDIREGLLAWLHSEHPEALPRLRGPLSAVEGDGAQALVPATGQAT